MGHWRLSEASNHIEITREDIPHNFQIAWDALGKDKCIEIIDELGGMNLYIPSNKLPSILTKYIEKRVDDFEAVNKEVVNVLIRETGAAETFIRKVLKQLENAEKA